ncbi:MAG: capsular biosynthesis protein, partial [Sulfitobacter sp.]
AENWPDAFTALVGQKAVTDIVLYGDTRPIHAKAIERARDLGLRIHVFEEGYLRPYWITYERGGSNGHSQLMQMSLADMHLALEHTDIEALPPPGHWGDTRQHVFYGALYHWFVMFMNGAYSNFRPHRSLPVRTEFKLHLKRLFSMPFQAIERRISTWRIKSGGFPYHLVLLQLEHDSAFQNHSSFETTTDFLATVMDGFVAGAPGHHHLVFKAHPLEDGRAPIRRDITKLAEALKVSHRVHFVRGGKLARLLDDAATAVTVNSTAGQQVLWRGIPLKVFGDAVYAKPQFVSNQALEEFFATPNRPDTRAYRDYRRYLLETSQLPGGFYSARGRRQLMRHVVDKMLLRDDPYDALRAGTASREQQLRISR